MVLFDGCRSFHSKRFVNWSQQTENWSQQTEKWSQQSSFLSVLWNDCQKCFFLIGWGRTTNRTFGKLGFLKSNSSQSDEKFEKIKGSSEYLEKSSKSIAIARLERFRLKFYFYNSTEQRQLWKALPISSADSSFNNLTCCEKNCW